MFPGGGSDTDLAGLLTARICRRRSAEATCQALLALLDIQKAHPDTAAYLCDLVGVGCGCGGACGGGLGSSGRDVWCAGAKCTAVDIA